MAPNINIDELVEPINVTVGGKAYHIDDVSPVLADEMSNIGMKAKQAMGELDRATELLVAAQKTKDETKITAAQVTVTAAEAAVKAEDSNTQMADIMAKVLGAEAADIKALGVRKLTRLITSVMGTINDEVEGKNAPKVKATP